MEPIEPMMATPGNAPDFAPVARSISANTINVRFAVQAKRGQRVMSRSFSQPKGQIRFTDEHVELIRLKHRLFRRPLETKWVFARSQIFDARIDFNGVHFEAHTPDGIQQVLLTAAGRGVKNKVFQNLPAQLTPTREAEQADLADYNQRIVALTPVTWVTYGLIAINLLVYLAMCADGVGIMAQNVALTVGWGTNVGPLTLRGEWWRLITSVFVHFGLFHLSLNMLTLYQMGRLAERMYGNMRYLALYLFAGITGSLTSVLWHPGVNSAGASGAIFGVFGALLVFVLKHRNELPTSLARQQRTSILMLLGYNLFYGFTQHGIDNGAHLGGLAGGILLGLALARPFSEPARSKKAVRSIVLAGVLAFTVLGASLYLLVEIREVINERLQQRGLVPNGK